MFDLNIERADGLSNNKQQREQGLNRAELSMAVCQLVNGQISSREFLQRITLLGVINATEQITAPTPLDVAIIVNVRNGVVIITDKGTLL